MAHQIVTLLLAGTAFVTFTSAPAAASYDRAAAAFSKGDPRTARVELLNAIKDNPDDGRAHLLQGRVYLELGDGMAAEAEIRRARETGVRADRTHHLLAQALLLQNKPADALQEAALAPTALAVQANRVTGQALAVQGQTDEAAAAFQSALAIAPNDAELWSDIGRLRLSIGDLDGARAAADRATRLAPKDLGGLLLQGDLARAEKEAGKALAWFDRVLAADAQNIPALLGRAAALSDAGRMRDMLAASRQVLKRDPKNVYAFYLQARLAAMAGNYKVARSLMQRIGEGLDNDPAAMLLAGVIEYRSGNDELAIDRLSRLVALQAGNWKARRVLAAAQWRAGSPDAVITTLQPLLDSIYADRFVLMLMARAMERKGDVAGAAALRQSATQPNPKRVVHDVLHADDAAHAGRWGEAVEHYESLRRQTGGKDPSILNNLAWAYGKAGSNDRAISVAEAAYTLDPENAAIADTLGWLLHEGGRDKARALKLLRQAAAKAPQNPNYRWHLANVLAADGQKDDARAELQAALSRPGFKDGDQARALLATL